MPDTIATTKLGMPITEELADELAREAEVGYDLSLARPVGRRSLAGSTGKSPRLNFRVTRDLYEPGHRTRRARRQDAQ